MNDTTFRVPTVWHDAYHCPDATHLLSTRKARAVVEAARAEGLLEEIPDTAFADESAVWREIGSTHDPAYVEAVRTGSPRRLAESQGFTWSPAFAESVARIWSGNLAACQLALERGIALIR